MARMEIVITVCLHIGLTLSRQVSTGCVVTTDGLCGPGQYLLNAQDGGLLCQPCPDGTFQNLSRHNCRSCKDHTTPRSDEIIVRLGSGKEDNQILCKSGFYRQLLEQGQTICSPCSECGDDLRLARTCSQDRDAVCCPVGTIVSLELQDGGDRKCVLETVKSSRKARSTNQTHPSSSSGASGADDLSDRDLQEGPNHGYVRADYEEEYPHNKVDFPVWARILCAGVAIGVFLFYLGVGIPCNACGSKDKLYALRDWIVHRHSRVATEEESKEKSPSTEKTTSEPV